MEGSTTSAERVREKRLETTFSVPKVAVSSMAESLPFVETRLAVFGVELPEPARDFLLGR